MKKPLIGLSVAVIAVLFGLFFYANRETENQIDLYIERALVTGDYKDIQYESAGVGLDATIFVNGLNVTDTLGIQTRIDSLEISDMDFSNEFPNSLSLSASGFSFPLGIPGMKNFDASTVAPGMESFFEAIFSTESIPATIDYSHEYQPDNSNLFSNVLAFSLPNAFSLSMITTTRNINYEEVNQIAKSFDTNDPAILEAFTAILMNAEIPEISYTLSDLGFVQTLLQEQAIEQGKSIDLLRQELISMTQSLLLFAPAGVQAIAVDLSNDLISFIEGNKTFNFAIRPEFSGNIQKLQAPILSAIFTGDYEEIVKLLNIEFSIE